jgi:hypothetical protein
MKGGPQQQLEYTAAQTQAESAAYQHSACSLPPADAFRVAKPGLSTLSVKPNSRVAVAGFAGRPYADDQLRDDNCFILRCVPNIHGPLGEAAPQLRDCWQLRALCCAPGAQIRTR